MIAHEHVRDITRKDIVFVLALALLASLFIYVGQKVLPLSLSFIFGVLVLSFMSVFVMHLVHKTGVFMLFYVFVALLTMDIDNVGVLGVKKVVCFAVAALLFELVYLVLKFRIHFLAFDLIVGSALSLAAIPFVSALLITMDFTLQAPLSIINWMLISFVFGVVGAILSCIVWHYMKDRVLFVELEMYLGMR